MRRLRLSTLLISSNVGLLLLAVLGVAVVAVRLLQLFADDQALARVTQAGRLAQQIVGNTGDAAATSAQLLAERPTLRRLLEANDRTNLERFLAQFQQTSGLDGSAVFRADQVVVASGKPLPWPALWAQTATQKRVLFAPEDGGPLLLGARAAVSDLPDHGVLVVVQLDPAFAQRLSVDVDAPVTIVGPQTISYDSARAGLWMQARAGATAAARVASLASYVAVVPLQAPHGAVIGAIETTLPTSGVAASVRRLVQTLLLLALGVTVLAVLVSFVLGRRLSRPLQALTDAAARIGQGDLLSPMPPAPSAEIGTLAMTLEEMRRRLLRLTADLQRQQAEAQAIITGIVEGVYTVDRERRIRYLNPQAAALLGVHESEAIGRFCGDVLQPEGVGGVRPCAEHCPIIHARFRSGARATEYLRLPGDQRRTVVITSAPAADEMQVQVIRDETEVEASRRLRDAILANISHEFKTPLSAQLASIELLQDQLPDLDLEQTAQLVRSLQRGTVRLTQLIDNLLEGARIEAGQHSIRHQSVALDEVIEEALELTRPLFDQRQQDIAVDLPYPLPSIVGDAPRLTQVFVNLLANANKFAPSHSTIMIGGSVAEAGVMLWVEDQGPGLPKLEGPAGFSRFVRAPFGEPEQSGVGLGLWLVQSIVERHGGRVEAHSLPHGTRMVVTLAVEQVHEGIGC